MATKSWDLHSLPWETSQHCDETLLSDVTMTSHDVAMTTLLHVSDLKNSELEDKSFYSDGSDSHTPSIDFPQSDYSNSKQTTSLRYYGNIDGDAETSCWLSDDDYSASFTDDANNASTNQRATKTSGFQRHPRFLDTSFISAQLPDDYYTPTPNRRQHNPNLAITTPIGRHHPKLSTTITRKVGHFAQLNQHNPGVPPTRRQGLKRKLTSCSETSSGSSSSDDSGLQVLYTTM